MRSATLVTALLVFALPAAMAVGSSPAPAGTVFTYQGKLEFQGTPVTDTCDFQFSLWDAPQGPNQVGTTQQLGQVDVTDGLFTVQVDFGVGVYDGNQRWLEIEVMCPGDGDFVTLDPRQEMTPIPYAVYAENTGGVPGDIHGVFGIDGLAGGGTEGIVELSIAPEGVTEDKIGFGAVSSDKLSTAAVTTDKIGLQAVTTDRLGLGSVTNDRLGLAAVTNDKINAGAVDSAKILDGSVDNLDIASGAVTTESIQDSSVDTADLKNDAVTSAKIKNGEVAAVDLATGAVTSLKILDGTVATADLSNLAVDSTKLASSAVTNAKLGGDAVTGDKIQNGAVDTLDINSEAVDSDKIEDGAVDSADIADDAIGSAAILDGSVDTADLAIGAVTTTEIDDGTISFADIDDNSATNGQVMKWNGSVWVAADDDTAEGEASGWVDDGTVVRLETSTDSVGIGTPTPSEKLDVDGNIHASGTIASGSSIVIDGSVDQITASGGIIDFDDEDVVTTGRAAIGPNNTNIGSSSFVAGDNNHADGNYATVGGGLNNAATGDYAAVPGGTNNTAMGLHSFAAGENAQAMHDGTFVWSEGGLPFASTSNGQFLIQASGGVGIGKNNPVAALDVAGIAQLLGLVMPTGAADGYVLTSNSTGQATWQPLPGSAPTSDSGTQELFRYFWEFETPDFQVIVDGPAPGKTRYITGIWLQASGSIVEGGTDLKAEFQIQPGGGGSRVLVMVGEGFWSSGGGAPLALRNLDPEGPTEDLNVQLSFSGGGGGEGVYITVTGYDALSQAPAIPSRPEGPDEGNTDQMMVYMTSTTDPEDDDVYYMWDWGDGDTSGWDGPYMSGMQAMHSHSWMDAGIYFIRVKAKDVWGQESGWSSPASVQINNP